MAKSTHAESRHLYSWWWDSHISPKNSKWLKENLTDMDIKVKTMIKLLEQDADSFARRAEMYYKKRPELLTLVEEFYRAYRALAERYDHANGALRQAQRTMVEVFPNQIPFVLADEPPSGSSATEAASHTPEMPPRIRAMLDSNDSHKDALRVPWQFHDIKKNGSYSEENDALTGKKGLNFQDEGKNSECKVLQEEVSQLSKENQNLKSQITSESARADNIDAEVRSLQEIISKLKSEKDAALLQHQLSQERISNLETEISCCQEALKKLEDEMLIVASKLRSAEERCLLLDKANQSLHLELDSLKQRAKYQQEELNRKQEELEKLNISIQDRHLQHVQAEMARLSSEKLQSQSQEEASLLALEVQSGIKKLKGMELDKVVLEEEIQKLKEENGSLNEHILASAYKIIDLQDEIIFLKDLIAKLEEKAGLHVEEKNVLLKEISCLKEDRNNLEQRHNRLTEQIEEVNFNVESLQTMVKELQNGNAELKEICKKYEDEKAVHLENLKHIEKMSEKNVVLENSLSDANVEIEGSREKIKTLEESCESLSGMISIHLSEKAVLVSKLESIAQEMEKLSERNTFLENSLSDVYLEVEVLRVKSEVLEESCRSLCAQNSSLISEKTTLVYQVERTIQSLENLETCYDELESKHSNLEMEKDLPLHRIVELQESFKREKEEYETLIMSIFLSSKSQLTTLENEICLLQEESRLREEEFEVEQHKIIDAQVENFILQRSLIDMNENNSILSELCQKNLEASECAEKLISELKQELVVQEKKLTSSSVRNEKLREGIQLMLRELCVNKECGSLDGIEDEVLLKLTLHEIRGLLNSISDIQNENQFLLLEKSVNITILNQFGLNVMNLITEKSVLEQESEVKLKELSVLQSKELELLEMNEQLRQDVQASNQRQESLETEMEVLRTQVIDLREAHGTLQSENCNLLEENQSLSKKFYDVGEKRDILEEENSVILAEVMTMEYLYLIFRSSSAEKESELQLLRSDLARLHGVKNDLDQEIRLMNEKLVAVETENVHLKETVVDLEESKRRLMIVEDDLNTTRDGCKQLNLDIESRKDILAQKDIELLQANHQFLSVQDKNTELCRDLEGLQLDINRVREDLENKIFRLSVDNAERDNEIVHLRQELDKLHTEVEGVKTKEEHLNYALRKGVDEVESCEVEIASLLDDIHITVINAAVFEEKAIELLIASDISAVVQRETLHEEITLKNANVDELKEKLASLEREDGGLKEEMDAYLLLTTALWDDISCLEEHTLLLANHRASNRPENQENLSQDIQHSKGSQKPSEYQSATVPTGLLEFQKLRAKVKALQKVVIDTESLLEQEMFESNASLVAAMKEIEVLKSEVQISKDIVMQLEKSKEPDPDLKLQESDVGSSKVKHEQMMKDIQLDHVLSSSQYGYDVASYGSNSMDKDGNNDQMLESWETTERDCDNPTQRASSVTSVHEIECLPIEVAEEEKSEYLSSEQVSQKELSFDKLELPNKVKVRHQDTNINAIERLSSDAQRLSFLRTSVQKLKKNLEISEMSDCCTSSEFDKVKSQVKEAEEAISRLIDTNRKLTKKAEKISPSYGSPAAELDEKRSTSRRKILEHARRGSEKIGRLELELQKIQYILLKLEEENEKKGADRRRVLLKDYLYGRYDARRKKKGSSCGCMRPKTKDD